MIWSSDSNTKVNCVERCSVEDIQLCKSGNQQTGPHYHVFIEMFEWNYSFLTGLCFFLVSRVITCIIQHLWYLLRPCLKLLYKLCIVISVEHKLEIAVTFRNSSTVWLLWPAFIIKSPSFILSPASKERILSGFFQHQDSPLQTMSLRYYNISLYYLLTSWSHTHLRFLSIVDLTVLVVSYLSSLVSTSIRKDQR